MWHKVNKFIYLWLALVIPLQVVGINDIAEYRIRQNDILDVYVLNHPELDKSVVVSADGYISYPLVELITPLSLLLLYFHYSLSFLFFASCLFTSALIALCFIDFYHQILPDVITLPGLVLALIYSLFRSDVTLTKALVGAVTGAGFLLLVYGIYYLLRKKEGLGMGDVTMMLMIGAYLGFLRTFFTLILASLAGALVGIAIIAFRKKDLQYSLPFGTFLAPAAFVSLLWGERIIHAYFNLYKDLIP